MKILTIKSLLFFLLLSFFIPQLFGQKETKYTDVSAPIISHFEVINLYSNRAVIGWETDEPSDTRLNFGEGNYSTNYTDTLKKRTHTVVLTHLKPNTTYQYKASSQDKFGNISEKIETPALTFTTTIATEEPSRWVVTYHPIYQWDEVSPNDVPWEQITHLYLGQLWPVLSDSGYTPGIEPGSYWAGDWGGFTRWKTEALKFIANGHKANRKVICMLGGAGSNPDGQWNSATSAGNVVEFAQNIHDVLEAIGFDGIDIDWEDNIVFPSIINLAKELRKVWPTAIITIPTGMNGDDAADFAPAKPFVNAFMPMSYYPIPQWGGWLIPVPITPLHSAGNNPYSIDYILNKWNSAGVPSSKILMGVGGFGSIWGDSNGDGLAPIKPYTNINDINGNANGESESIGSDNLVTWSFVQNVLGANTGFYESWDDTGLCNYWHTVDITKQISVLYPGKSYYLDISLIFYETARSMSEKVDYIEKNKMKGVGYWTLSQLIHEGYSPVLDVASCLKLDTSAVQGPIRINNHSLTDMEIYPNPVGQVLYINNLKSENDLQVKIIDCMGKVVCEKTLLYENNRIQLPDFKGVYVVILIDKSGKIIDSRKIVKLE